MMALLFGEQTRLQFVFCRLVGSRGGLGLRAHSAVHFHSTRLCGLRGNLPDLCYPDRLARVFPFQPYRYSAKAGPVENLVTQPYDKISPGMQARYLSLSPYNLVRIILGERRPGASEGENP